MWNGSGGFDGSREFDRSRGSDGSRGSRGSRGSNSSRRSDEYIGSEGSHAHDESGGLAGPYTNNEFGGSGGPYVNDESGGSGGPYMNAGSSGSGGSRSSGSSGYHGSGDSGSGGSGSGGSGGPYMNDGSGGSGGPYVNDESGGFQGPYAYGGAGGSSGSGDSGSGGSDGSGSGGSGGSRGSRSWARPPSMNSVGPRGTRRPSLLFNVQRPIENKCMGYYSVLAGLFCQTVGEIERITKVDPSVPKNLPLIAAFYNQYGYSGNYGYKVYETREELKDYLRQVFTDERQRTARHQRMYLRMKLAVGYHHALKPWLTVVALKAWTEDGELNYYVVDYTRPFNREQRLPQDHAVNLFYSFEPIFYFDSFAPSSGANPLFGIGENV